MKAVFGKYRGKITSIRDPDKLGRVRVEVPAILGDGKSSWAMPCTPYAGKDIGLFTVPPVGSNVWVEFEAGDPDHPIWSGCFWGKGELPQQNDQQADQQDQIKFFKTEGIACTLSNLDGNKGVTLEVKKPVVERPLKMIFNADGVEINNNNETVVTITKDVIKLDNRANSTLTVAIDDIQLKEKSVEINMTPSTIELIDRPSKIKMTTSNIELSNGASKQKIAAGNVEIKNATGKLNVSPAAVELANGAASVKLSPVSVNVNNGALEVI